MAIPAIGGGMPGANPLAGMGGAGGAQGGNPLNGLAGSLGVGGGDSGAASTGAGSGLAPVQQASGGQGASFGDALKTMMIEGPSSSKAHSKDLTARFAAGDKSIDAHTVAIQSAKAGVEIQMATRSISSAVSAVRTLFQMQV